MTESIFKMLKGIKQRQIETGLYSPYALHIHSLRHSACSICYMLGWTIEEARDWLGHGSEDVTIEVYQHYRKKVGVDKVKVLGDAFA